MAFIEVDNFVNRFELKTTELSEQKLIAYIERYSDDYLKEMLGLELFDLFMQGVEDEDPIYLALRNKFTYQNNCEIINSKGVEDMLLGIVYFYFARDLKVQQTTVAGKMTKNENSNPLQSNSWLFSRYNDSIATYKAIQQYCIYNRATYPTFKGINKKYAYLTN